MTSGKRFLLQVILASICGAPYRQVKLPISPLRNHNSMPMRIFEAASLSDSDGMGQEASKTLAQAESAAGAPKAI